MELLRRDSDRDKDKDAERGGEGGVQSEFVPSHTQRRRLGLE